MKKIIAVLLLGFTCLFALSAFSKKEFEQKTEQFLNSSKGQYIKLIRNSGAIVYVPRNSITRIYYSESSQYIDVAYGNSSCELSFKDGDVTIAFDSAGNLIYTEL